ncbi:hypothetical protein HDV00_005204 [Rhizophlyctis rosea]|nr:hypothetical protein HDV00_005204 [Rhizophlyctis rosea]
MRASLILVSTLFGAVSAQPYITLPNGGVLKGVSVSPNPQLHHSSSPKSTSQFTTNTPHHPTTQKIGHDAYHNIPFAQAPIADLRWKSPLPPKPWTGTRDATKWGKSCVQFDPNAEYPGNFPLYQDEPIISPDHIKAPYGEDCLNLNVFVPRGGKDKKPVVLFLHGGGLIFGSASGPVFDGQYLAASQDDAIIVTANYRLGAFGYLGSAELQAENSDGSTGNFGFLDQRRALEWIQDNISAFGGDASQVTLMGQSAGAQSTLWHLIYTNDAAKAAGRTKKLFNKVVMTSPNPPLKPYGMTPAQNQFNNMANFFNCTSTVAATKIACLRNQSADAINTYTKNLWTTSYRKNGAGPFAMVVDGAAIPTAAWTRLQAGQYDTSVKITIGDNENEGTGFIRDDAPDGTGDGYPTLDTFVAARFAWITPDWRAKLVSLYTTEYTKLRDQKTSLYGDLVFNCPNRLLARKWATTNPAVYYFHNNLSASQTESTYLLGSPHASELIYFLRYLPGLEREDEFVAAWQMGKALTQFVANGDPNAEGSQHDDDSVQRYLEKMVGKKVRDVEWPAFKKAGGSVVEWDSKTSVGTDANKFCDLLDQVFAALLV